MHALAPVLALGIPAVIGVLFFAWCKRAMDGPDAAIVVVDRRTMRSAIRKIATAQEAGDIHRAAAGLTALSGWLRDEIAAGPRRYRAGFTDLKRQVDATLAAARDALAMKVGR